MYLLFGAVAPTAKVGGDARTLNCRILRLELHKRHMPAPSAPGKILAPDSMPWT